MSILALAAAGIATGGAADVTPNAVNWANITSASSPAANANQTVNGCSTSITISAANSSTGILSYRLDSGSYTAYSGPFTVDAASGQTLNWQVGATLGNTVNGTITVTNDSDGSTTLDTFTYDVTNPL